MQPNPVLRRLGFSDTDRVAIIHTDDIGMCLPSVNAFRDLWDVGLISSGAVMVPCPWFLKAAEYARENPQADLGVHITLTSEHRYYRWGPVSTRDPESGLIDEEGCFYHNTLQAREYGKPEYVLNEIRAQVQRAFDMGMQPTHMDTHMGTVASPSFMQGYLQVALAYRLPPMIFRGLGMEEMRAGHMDEDVARLALMVMGQLEEMGLPMLDQISGVRLDQHENRLEQTKQALNALQPGLTHFILHPCHDTPELCEITTDWRGRVADYQTFMSEELHAYITKIGLQVIGYRALQALMPDPSDFTNLPF